MKLNEVEKLLYDDSSETLESLAQQARDVTRQRFGNVIQMYAPLYVSNECVDTCTYCGFSRPNEIDRKTLSVDEVKAEADYLINEGFRHLLLVAGEHPQSVSAFTSSTETMKAAGQLVKEGFTVLPYIQADPVLAKQLADLGTATVMPLASPIGSNQGLKTRQALEIIIEQAEVPVVVDAGLGAPSHACEAMELGADAVLVNTAIATAEDPVAMARAFAQAVEAGRSAFLAGGAAERKEADASSPLTGFLRMQASE